VHVCFINPPNEYYSPISGGAIATITMQHARELLRRGHQVSVLTPVNGDELYTVGQVFPIQPRQRHELSFPKRALSRVRRKLHQWDAAYYEWYMRSFVKALRQLSPAPDVIIFHNDFVSPKYAKRAIPSARVFVDLQNEQRTNQRDLGPLLQSVQRLIACSRHIHDWTMRQHNLPAGKLAIINNGIDPEAFYPRPDYLAASTPLRVLCIGRIDRNKGADIAADAIQTLQSQGIPIHLTVAGGIWFYGHGNEMSDPYFRELKQKMDLIKADYLGHIIRPNVPELVRNHDVVCVLSRTNDPNPLVCLEAMASGCAVVGSNRGGIPDACGEASLLIDPDNRPAVEAALQRLEH